LFEDSVPGIDFLTFPLIFFWSAASEQYSAVVKIFTARRYASAVYAVPDVRLSVCHTPVLYRNGRTDQVRFRHRGWEAYLTFSRKGIRYLQEENG